MALFKPRGRYEHTLSKLAGAGVQNIHNKTTYSDLRHYAEDAKKQVNTAKLNAGAARSLIKGEMEKRRALPADPVINPYSLLARGDQLVKKAKDALSKANRTYLAEEDLDIAMDQYFAAVHRNPVGAGRRAERVANYLLALENNKNKDYLLRRLGGKIRILLETAEKLEKAKK